MADSTLSLGLDATGAKVGADEYNRAIETILAHNRQAMDSFRATETALSTGSEKVSKSARGMGDSFQRAFSTIATSGGSVRAGVSSIGNELLGAAGNAEGMASALGLSAGAVGPLAAVAAGVTAIGAGLYFGTKKAFELEASLAHLASRTPTGDVRPYEAAAIRLAKVLGVDAVQAAGAFEAAAFSGISKFDDQVETAALALKLFKTEGTDAAQAVGLIDAALDAYNEPAAKAAEVTDQILSLATSGETKFADMAQAIGQLGAKAKGTGVDMLELGGVLAELAPKSGGAVGAAASLQSLLLKLSDPASNVTKEIRQQGVAFDETTIRTKGFVNAIRDLVAGFSGREDVLRGILGDPRAAQAAFILIEDGGKKAKDAVDAAKVSTGQLGDALDKVEALGSSKWEKLVANVKAGATEIGEGVKGMISELAFLPETLASLGSKAEAVFNGKQFQLKERPGEFFTEEDIRRLDEAKATLDAIGETSKAIVAARTNAQGFALSGPGDTKIVDRDQLRALDEALEKLKTLRAEKRALLSPEGPVPEIVPPIVIPKVAPPRPENLPAGESQNVPVPALFAASDKAIDEAKKLSDALDREVGTALDREIAKIRQSEDALREKIKGYRDLQETLGDTEAAKALGTAIDDLTQKLLGLSGQNDEAVRAARELDAHEKAAANSAKAASEARQQLAQSTKAATAAERGLIFAIQAVVEASEKAAKSNKLFSDGPGKLVEDYRFQVELIGKTADEQERLTLLRQFDTEVLRAQAEGMTDANAKIEESRKTLEKLANDAKLRRDAEALGHAFADPITQGLESAVFEARKASDVFKGIVSDILRNLFRLYVSNPLQQGIVSLFGPSERGNVFENGSMIPFEKGGVPDVEMPDARRAVRYELGGVPDAPEIPGVRAPVQFELGGVPEQPSFRNVSRAVRYELGGVPDQPSFEGATGAVRYELGGVPEPPRLGEATRAIRYELGGVPELPEIPDLVRNVRFELGGVPDVGSNAGAPSHPRSPSLPGLRRPIEFAMGGVPALPDLDDILQGVRRYELGGIPALDDARQNVVRRFELGGVPGLPGEVVPFALGGLNTLPDLGSQPAAFAMGGGRTGTIREGGKTEAIMPVLGRTAGGRLGVELIGGSPKTNSPTPIQQVDNSRKVSANFFLQGSIDDRSRRQISDDLQRLAMR